MDDFLTPEAGVVAAVTAAVFSPRVRGLLRRGAVYGLAGALYAGDTVASFARGMERGVRETVAADPTAKAEAQQEAAAGGGA